MQTTFSELKRPNYSTLEFQGPMDPVCPCPACEKCLSPGGQTKCDKQDGLTNVAFYTLRSRGSVITQILDGYTYT